MTGEKKARSRPAIKNCPQNATENAKGEAKPVIE